MTAKHETIHIGDSEIRAEVNDSITWKLKGEGFTAYEPIVHGQLTVSGTGMVNVQAGYSIRALGNMRILTIDPFDWGETDPAGTPLTFTPVPLGHRPIKYHYQQSPVRTSHAGAVIPGFYQACTEIAPTGVVYIRGIFRNLAPLVGVQGMTRAGNCLGFTITYPVS
jgi:hypothetical protein